MASFINTNIASLNAQRNLTTSQASLNTSLQRLSSGLRINSAKDDAAGLAISQRLTSQIGGLNQAARNANDGISLAQTAEGDLTQIGNNLQRIRDLAVQAANGSNSASDRAALNNEASQLVSEINRVASNSNFNGVNLLDGSFTNQTFQVGANGTSNDQITIGSIASAKSTSLGVGSGSSYATNLSGSAATTDALGAGGLVVNGFNVGSSSSDGVSYKDSNGSAIAKAAAINAASGNTGVTATVSANTVTGTGATGFATAVATGDIKINGVDLGPLGAAGSAAERGAQVTAAVNAKSSQTGVTASYDTTTGAVSLTATDGRNITIEKAATGGSDDNVTGLTTGGGAGVAYSVTTSAQVNLSSSSDKGITVSTGSDIRDTTGAAATTGISAGDLKINGVDIGAVTASTAASVTGQNLVDAINKVTSKTGVAASTTTAGAVTLTSVNGANFDITATAAANTAFGYTTGTTTISAAAGAGTTAAGLTAGTKAATVTAGAGLSSLDLSTASGATSALTTIDAALASVNSSRASLGAYQNRLSSAVTSLQTSAENFTASRSRIQDADFAQETASLTRGQVLQQAGTAILAQANALPQGVLALLR
ncbi:flagellin [Undibacterium sp. Rencai35W]|uniref:flagellin N-terminal helical domain-containing protein n=1 Tax=Undibacterium sp. Rencai35W TaxID=3413046 RepID=UPI003BF400DC